MVRKFPPWTSETTDAGNVWWIKLFLWGKNECNHSSVCIHLMWQPSIQLMFNLKNLKKFCEIKALSSQWRWKFLQNWLETRSTLDAPANTTSQELLSRENISQPGITRRTLQETWLWDSFQTGMKQAPKAGGCVSDPDCNCLPPTIMGLDLFDGVTGQVDSLTYRPG